MGVHACLHAFVCMCVTVISNIVNPLHCFNYIVKMVTISSHDEVTIERA